MLDVAQLRRRALLCSKLKAPPGAVWEWPLGQEGPQLVWRPLMPSEGS